MDLAAGITATKTGFELIKSLREILGRPEPNPSDIQARLVELQALMLDAQRSIADAEEENRLLHREIDALRRTSEIGERFIFDEGVYWFREYPYCPNCWDVDRKPMMLNGPFVRLSSSPDSEWRCCVHRTSHSLRRRAHWK